MKTYTEQDLKECYQFAQNDMRKCFSSSYVGMTFEQYLYHKKIKDIYQVYLSVYNQEESDYLKKICEDYSLPIWNEYLSFRFLQGELNYFTFSTNNKEVGDFGIYTNISGKVEITKEEFLQLVKETFKAK